MKKIFKNKNGGLVKNKRKQEKLPPGSSKYPQRGSPTAVAPTAKQTNPKQATHVE
ncbi:hypothetical protein Phum_PHUM087060 [Pediculus humanus corporis]|uniref:Uncharacterized protein n=1 Tax=Pediculus humanus subsp. corporis TaxID=121224 RepID=E0VCG8_PEDHC|nr:uncharacterized protein Phum_PHUM087060 [Pediculus humanus corporis]EEB11074.1 hypothetical protein Phum_PHUM087060 [Pediculus humanus corporis]